MPLRDIWVAQVAHENSRGSRIEVLSWLRRMALDVIGQPAGCVPILKLLVRIAWQFEFPRLIKYTKPVPGTKALAAARNKLFSIGIQIVSESKASIKGNEDEEEKALSGRRDLLVMLLKANLSANIPENQRLTDAEVIAQIPTFFVAGHETTSSATAWALNELSLDTAIQNKLREELITISTDNPTMDELNSLPYLEMVVREVMRVHAHVMFIHRMAMEDDVLPLAKPYVEKDGEPDNMYSLPASQHPKGSDDTHLGMGCEY
ncbi:cytochrome P450 [Mycena latifolia]|nr:cytochrome P450 [Mycena latifolia]